MIDFDETLKDTAFYKFMGADNIKELKKQIIEVIVNEIRQQLEDSEEYIIDPDAVASDLYQDVVDEVINEVKKEYKEKINEAVDARLEKMNL